MEATMQWTDLEPDAANLANVSSQRDWCESRSAETDRVGQGAQRLLDGIGSDWQGEAAESWKAGVTSIIDVLLACRAAYQRAQGTLSSYHEGLAGLRTVMDEVRQTEASWNFTLETNQAVVNDRSTWLAVNPASAVETNLFLYSSIRHQLVDAESMVIAAQRMLAEAQGQREECAARRRALDSEAMGGMRAAETALPREFPPAVNSGDGVIPETFGRALIRATLLGLSNDQFKELFMKDSSGKLAALLTGTLPRPGDQVEGIDAAIITALAGLAATPATLDRRAQLTKLFGALSTAQAIKLAYLFPGLGNLDGVPFKARYAGNEINIAAAVAGRKARQPELNQAIKDARGKLEEIQKKYDYWLANGRPKLGSLSDNPFFGELRKAKESLAAAEKAITDNNQAIDNYWAYLTEKTPTYAVGSDGRPTLGPDGRIEMRTGHQILIFSDEGPGAIAEVWGDPESAEQIGLAVPGTTTNMANFPGVSNNQAKSMMERAIERVKEGSPWPDVAMISWAGGEFPQGIPFMDGIALEKSAGDTSYAQELGSRLHRFNDALTAATPTAKIAASGYSYGGSILGEAQKLGMNVNRALYIAPAGMGPGVDSTYDFPKAASTKYYQMTAPGDPIWISQQSGIHGGDPKIARELPPWRPASSRTANALTERSFQGKLPIVTFSIPKVPPGRTCTGSIQKLTWKQKGLQALRYRGRVCPGFG
ncbi:alpha/beta hydrolase [Acaricomes phytoseiuli]|uniref:alpha/beta hydrolase n=1 Tax=Acaricomes phytoseiuli TaxID=291968 RepID=UPI0003A1F7C7|nr:alpha/beta hydrolase [Acaricomes phytoseiuli]